MPQSPARLGLSLLTGFAFCLVCGCGGSSMIKVKGKVQKDGAPLSVDAKDILEVTFVTYVEKGPPTATYSAATKDDNSFEVRGDEGKGIPPGKYRISVRVMNGAGPFAKDKLREKYGLADSPIVHEVSAENAQVDIDLAQYVKK